MSGTRHSTAGAPSKFPRVPREAIAGVVSALSVVIVVGAYVFVTGSTPASLSVATRGRTGFAAESEAVGGVAPADAVQRSTAGLPAPELRPSSPTPSPVPPQAPSPSNSTESPAAAGGVTVLGAAVAAPANAAAPVATPESGVVERIPTPAPSSGVPAVVATTVAAPPSTPTAAPAAAGAASTPPAAASPPVLTERERGLLDAMNARRASAGLAMLEPLATLTSAARARSNDMLANNYFAHTSPTGQTWYSLLSIAGVGYSAGGENLAKVSGSVTASVAQAIEALMASPTHRANILNPAFRKVGVGAAGQADQLTIFTSIFTDR